MAYEKTVWQTGDIVTSEKLNKIEQGIVDAGPMIVLDTVTDDGSGDLHTLDKTFNEIKTALDAGMDVKIILHYELHGLTATEVARVTACLYGSEDDDFLGNLFCNGNSSHSIIPEMFDVTSMDEYPSVSKGK